MHEQFAASAGVVGFAIDAQNEFYNQFYLAFTQVAAVPPETFEVPSEIAAELARNFKVAVNNMTQQAASGYAAQTELSLQVQQEADKAVGGKVMGTMISLTDKLSDLAVQTPSADTLKLPYEYKQPQFKQLTQLVESIK
jgi:hypothetical protein